MEASPDGSAVKAIRRTTFSTAIVGIVVSIVVFARLLPAQGTGRVDFERDIQPLFRTNCYSCHGPSMQMSNFRLDRRQDSLPNRVGANGARVVPGNSAASRLYLRVTGQAGLQMPPTGALSSEQIGLLKAWIDQGAEWPDELAGEAPSAPQDPVAAKMMDSIRRADRATFEKLLHENPRAARGQGFGGVTPLMFAALYGDIRSAGLLLDAGVDPNTRNDMGATALLWAIDDLKMTRLLLDHGAAVNVRSGDGTTPLLLAAPRFGSGDVVQLLLDHGAEVKGLPLLARASPAGDEAVLRILIEHGADKKPLPADLATRSGCVPCVDLLLPFASPDDLNRALAVATRFGDSKAISMLLDHGATANSPASKPAAASENSAGANAPRPAPDRTARAAVEKSLPLLQKADVVFLRKAGCVSCHNNSLTEMTITIARKNGFSPDETIAQSQLSAIRAYLESWRERVLQDIPIPGGVDTIGYILGGLAASNYPPDPATDALARYLKRRQAADGRWRIAAQRPPIESSDFEATAMALRSLRVYAPAPQQEDYARAVEKGTTWLSSAQPNNTEDRVFQLLGLTWAGSKKEAVRKASRELIEMQRSDGGWAQLPSLSSDAYATGQALTALAGAGELAVTSRAYQRGVQYLLSTQGNDGSWYVGTRTSPVQPYFDSEFPHERDQFISAAATNWATMALAPAAARQHR